MREHAAGKEEGIKDRPCAIVLMLTDEDGDRVITVLPITHSPPANPAEAVEIPTESKQRLGLDSARSWVVLTEANRFVWPGPDLRPSVSGDTASVAYGALPHALFTDIRRKFAAAVRNRLVRAVVRTS
jgi:hypothetical protein